MHNPMFRPKEAMRRALTLRPSSTRSSSSRSSSGSGGRRRKNNAFRDQAPMSPPAQSRLELLPRIASFRHKGWITAREEREFIKTLSEQQSNPFDRTTVESIKKALNEIQRAQDSKYSKHEPKPKATTIVAPGKILEPSDLQLTDEDYLQELFCEMCFFARLGFVQPPSCLQCVYKESIQGTQSDPHCQRLVVWRKNARLLLHPQQLDDNVVLVECRAVRHLLEEKTVDAHQWDKEKRQLLYHM